MIKMTEYAKRRKQLIQKIGPNSILILAAAPEVLRNGDAHYRYRQHSDFYYLTGFEEPEAVAIIAPKRKGGEFILFNRVRDHEQEIWNGLRAGQDGAKKMFGADEAYPIHELAEKLPKLLEGREAIYYTVGIDKDFDVILLDAVNKIRGRIRSGVETAFIFKDVTDSLHEMRLVKSPAEVALMRKAADIAALGHIRAMQACRPGVHEYQLEAELTYEFQRHGAPNHAYTPIVGSGRNTCILHYISNNQPIENNALVLIDAGCEYQNYASDLTRTFPANGKFSAEQRAIYDIVLAAQLAAINAMKPGVPFENIHTITVEIITQGLLDVGILKGKLRDLIEKRAYFPFYMHRAGHWLGLDVHDVGRYKIGNKWRLLAPGMVRTVEPGIYISADSPGVHKRWHNIGVRIEDDILVTEKGRDVLSDKLPKTVADIENIMRS